MNDCKPIRIGVECPDCKVQEWIDVRWFPSGPPVGLNRRDNSGWGVNWKCPKCDIETSGRLQVEKQFEMTTVGER